MEQFQEETEKLAQEAAKNQRSNEVNLLKMIESRIMEIIQIEDECKRKLPKLYNQRLPRFMRRRAACHDPNRVPKRWRATNLSTTTGYGSKSRKTLMKYRRRVKFRKHKRSLRKHNAANYKNPDKCLLHKWFAKRFKIENNDEIKYVPLHNNVKNQRNLARQARYGCSYLCMAHLIPIQLVFSEAFTMNQLDAQLDPLNDLTKQIAGFTFRAKALKSGNYQLAVHLYKPETNLKEYLCLALVNLSVGKEEHKRTRLNVWVPQANQKHVLHLMSSLNNQQPEDSSKLSFIKMSPKDCTRIRLVGPEARDEALKIALNQEKHRKAIEDVDLKLSYSLGLSIGLYIEETDASFVYYKTNPHIVDIVFAGKGGRMLWYKLIKNKSHLVGGYRDLSRVLADERFQLKPDCLPN